MASVIKASNADAKIGKWFPYYYLPFDLGRIGDGNGSTDGNTYITQTADASSDDDDTISHGICFDSHNCGFYYILEYTNTILDRFLIKKYDLNDNLIDTIYASYESATYYDWDAMAGLTNCYITIDIGVAVKVSHLTEAEDGDIYKITLPSYETMERRKIYHGGYSTYLKMPEVENVSYHSDIIPTSLKEKSISISFNPKMHETGSNGQTGSLVLAAAANDVFGNGAISLSLAWNTNKDGAHATAASDGAFSWAADETWSFGSAVFQDSGTVFAVTSSDFPAHTNVPASDTTPSAYDSGTAQTLNATVSGRAGFAKIRTEYVQGAGGSFQAAANQYWPCILMIN